ncbi:Leucine-rich repeat receptor-like protein kinase pxc1 [Thalictrum thalictroides]|uniref:Leucine-rich repeat receptor-like protein kinase pxc1 n=1 Tax=Thalictrum thalictroides TaxID=46969 RepID=A0A7J6W4A3_THATH|nr:Leucine-rich repeat receptor-like protein kinase pxc1 [Thalictrum thalictroides]
MARLLMLYILFVSLFIVLQVTNSEEEEIKRSLIKFLTQLTHNSSNTDPTLGWSMNTDPCINNWTGITCDSKSSYVKKIVLDGFSLTGTFDAESLCKAQNLNVLSFNNNKLIGDLSEEIGNCKQLTHLLLSDNQFSGKLPDSASGLSNLKKLEIFNNKFSGKLPNLARISGLVSFLAENNQITGEIPSFDFSNLQYFNVSNNNFTGPVPDLKQFRLSSISGNPGLCGGPMPNACPPSAKKSSNNHSLEHTLMYAGYILIGIVVVGFIAYKLFTKKKTENVKIDVVKLKGVSVDTSSTKPSMMTSEYKTSASKTDYSASAESAMMSSSMIVLSSPVVKGLKFEDLLKAPAELLGRGKHGSLYKVVLEDGIPLVVKRIKDWAISGEDFKRRMQKIDGKKHTNVLPAVAFYSSKQEKLVVYKYQQNGSLFKLIYGTQNGETFDWDSRLHVASKMAEALAFMHKELLADGIAHGNLKSSNILLSLNMDPCISEYGLMVMDNEDNPSLVNGNALKTKTKDGAYSIFKMDMYAFGVILLELLTGKLVDNNGLDLAKWVHSVVSEEWTVEVFDKNLVKDGASEERMVRLLQVALKCTNPSPEVRPSMHEVASMINTIREEEEASIVSEAW